MDAEILYRKIIEELVRRERNGKWDILGKPHPMSTAGAILFLHKEGISKEHHKNTLIEISRKVNDAESLRYLIRALYELGLPTEEAEDKLRSLYEEGMWKVVKNLPPDPLTTSTVLVTLHGTPLLKIERDMAVVSVMKRETIPEELSSIIGGQRPVLTNLYRALALSLYGKKEQAKNIWNNIRTLPLEDLPPKVYLEAGMKKDVHYPAVLASLLAKNLGEDPLPYVKILESFNPAKEDTGRLVTIGFYLGKLLNKF